MGAPNMGPPDPGQPDTSPGSAQPSTVNVPQYDPNTPPPPPGTTHQLLDVIDTIGSHVAKAGEAGWPYIKGTLMAMLWPQGLHHQWAVEQQQRDHQNLLDTIQHLQNAGQPDAAAALAQRGTTGSPNANADLTPPAAPPDPRRFQPASYQIPNQGSGLAPLPTPPTVVVGPPDPYAPPVPGNAAPDLSVNPQYTQPGPMRDTLVTPEAAQANQKLAAAIAAATGSGNAVNTPTSSAPAAPGQGMVANRQTAAQFERTTPFAGGVQPTGTGAALSSNTGSVLDNLRPFADVKKPAFKYSIGVGADGKESIHLEPNPPEDTRAEQWIKAVGQRVGELQALGVPQAQAWNQARSEVTQRTGYIPGKSPEQGVNEMTRSTAGEPRTAMQLWQQSNPNGTYEDWAKAQADIAAAKTKAGQAAKPLDPKLRDQVANTRELIRMNDELRQAVSTPEGKAQLGVIIGRMKQKGYQLGADTDPMAIKINTVAQRMALIGGATIARLAGTRSYQALQVAGQHFSQPFDNPVEFVTKLGENRTALVNMVTEGLKAAMETPAEALKAMSDLDQQGGYGGLTTGGTPAPPPQATPPPGLPPGWTLTPAK